MAFDLEADGNDTNELPTVFAEIVEGFLHVLVGGEFDDLVFVVSEYRHGFQIIKTLVFLKAILLPNGGLGLLVLMGEIGLEARAEVDVPAPEPTQEGFGILVVMRAELAVFAGVLGHRDAG